MKNGALIALWFAGGLAASAAAQPHSLRGRRENIVVRTALDAATG